MQCEAPTETSARMQIATLMHFCFSCLEVGLVGKVGAVARLQINPEPLAGLLINKLQRGERYDRFLELCSLERSLYVMKAKKEKKRK